MAKRYIPPGAKPKVAAIATSSTNHVEDSQRSLDDLVREQGSDVFTVKLEAATLYSKGFEKLCCIVVNLPKVQGLTLD